MSKRPHDPDEMPIDEWRHRTGHRSVREQGAYTRCYATLCRYAKRCPAKTARPTYIPQAKCPRYWPEYLRPPASLSSHLLKLLKMDEETN